MITMHFSRYLKLSAFVMLFILLPVIAFNRLIDPYLLYNGPLIDGLNLIKPVFSTHIRLSKAEAVRKKKPASIVLGSSRAEAGIDPSHPGWKVQPVYNLGLVGANIYETFRYLQHAQAIQPLQQVVLMLDFFMFNAIKNQNAPDFDESRLIVDADGQSQPRNRDDYWATLISLDAIADSKKTIIKQHLTGNSNYRANGMRDPTHNTANMRNRGGHHEAFLEVEMEFFNEHYDQFSFTMPKRDNWHIYRKLLMFVQQQGIDLYIAISPAHALQFETIAAKGIWNIYEQWKQQLVAINETVAQQQGQSPFPLWDFTGYSSVTTESLPAKDDRETAMQWYWDCSHYKKELGDLVLDKIFNYSHPDRNITDEFGVRLTSENIETHLQQVREDRQKWRTSHPENITEVEAL